MQAIPKSCNKNPYTFTFLIAALFFIFFSACSSTKIANSSFNYYKVPKVKVDIKLDKEIFAVTETMDLGITVKLTNNTSTTQQMLFDIPKSVTGGPWNTIAKIFNVKTNTSVLKDGNSLMSASKEYTHEQLKNQYTQLLPGESIEKKYKLSDIAAFKSSKYPLYTGTYTMRIFYYDNASNLVTFMINRFYKAE